jgi:hypothetical protein
MNTIQTIQLDAGEFLQFIDGVLTPLEQAIPAVAQVGGPIGLATSAAAAILPLLSKIPIGEVYTVEQQQSILDRVQALNLLDFSAPGWQRSVPKATTPPTTPPTTTTPPAV